jgi:hypothetical protein
MAQATANPVSVVTLVHSKAIPFGFVCTDGDVLMASLKLTVSKYDINQRETFLWQEIEPGDRFSMVTPDRKSWARFGVTSVTEFGTYWEFGILADNQGDPFREGDIVDIELLKGAGGGVGGGTGNGYFPTGW